MSERISLLAKDAKSKTKRILHIDDTKRQLETQNENVLNEVLENPGFNPEQTLNSESSTLGKIKEQLPDNFHELAHVVRHPRSAAKGKTAATLATSQEPYASREDDEELVSAYDDLQEAELLRGSAFDVNGRVAKLEEVVDEKEGDREKKRVAWTTSRYIHRARVVQAGHTKFPLLSPYRWIEDNGELQGSDWKQIFKYGPVILRRLKEEPPVGTGEGKLDFNRDVLLQHVERIVMASTPLQLYVAGIAKLATWHEPVTTASWFAAWTLLWFFNRIFTFIICYLAYSILRKKSGREGREQLKTSHKRAMDEDAVPETLGEMVRRHGADGWTDPLIDAVGPLLQPQIKDLADWMEALLNFHDWKTPRTTKAISIFFGTLIVAALFTSTDVCVQVITAITILTFFVHRPILHRYPRFYLIFAPAHWIFWDIPTHMETSFRYLRLQADIIRDTSFNINPALAVGVHPDLRLDKVDADVVAPVEVKSILQDGKVSIPAASDILVARCKLGSTSGTLVINFDHIRFLKQFPKEEMWKRRFSELLEVKKGNGQTSVDKNAENSLEILFKDGYVEKIEELQSKDEVFNVIVAFSGLAWLQM